jgi:hypothetical protein
MPPAVRLVSLASPHRYNLHLISAFYVIRQDIALFNDGCFGVLVLVEPLLYAGGMPVRRDPGNPSYCYAFVAKQSAD